jgi:protein-L-isoaspartate(D-aspartate) O-methyltransferase
VSDAQAWELRQSLVGKLRREGRVRTPRVEAALRAVPRELFVPGVPLDEVYRPSDAIVVKRLDGVSVSSASAPDVVAVMLEQLAVEPGQHILEIGAGTGYNAALLAELVGSQGAVISLDIDDDLVQAARAHLQAAGYEQVQVVLGDGALGFALGAPYERLILTVGADDLAPAWVEQLRHPGGRMVLPLAIAGMQRCVAFEHLGDHLVSRGVLNCSFIPLRGVLAAAGGRVPLGPNGEMAVGPLGPGVSSAGLYARLTGPARVFASGVSTTPAELAHGLLLWLAAREPSLAHVWANSGPLGQRSVPDLFGESGKWRATLGLVDVTGLALLGWLEDAPGELAIRASVGAEDLAEHLRARLQDWHAHGRPMDDQLQIRAYPRDHQPVTGQAVIHQRWTTFALDWLL